MRKHIQDLARRGKPNVMPLLMHDSDVEFVHERLQVAVHNTQTPAIGFASMPDTLRLFAWMHKDSLIKALEREIDANAGNGAMSHTERAESEAELCRESLALEREEAAHVHRAQEAGLPIEHRSDCSPLAILQIRLVTRLLVPRAHRQSTPIT